MLDPTAPLGSSPSVSEIIGTYGGNKLKIAQAIQMGLLDPTKGTLAGMEIDRIRNAAIAEQKPTQTVAQQTLSPQPQPQPQPQGPANAGKMINPGMPSGPAPQMASAGLGARPPGMAAGGLASLPVPDHMFNEGSFAGGGIVSFANGGNKGTLSVPQPYGAVTGEDTSGPFASAWQPQDAGYPSDPGSLYTMTGDYTPPTPRFSDIKDAYFNINNTNPTIRAAAHDFISKYIQAPSVPSIKSVPSTASVDLQGDPSSGMYDASDSGNGSPNEGPSLSDISRIMTGNNPYGAPRISDLKFQNPSFTEPEKPKINIQGDESQLGLNTDDPKDYYAAGKALLAKVNDPKSNLSDFQKSTLTARANDYIAGARTSTAVADSPSLGSMIENLGPFKYFMKPSSIAENQNGLGALATKRTADLAALGTPRGGLPTTSNPPAASTYPAGSNPYTANILTPMTASKEDGLAALLDSTSAPPSRTGNAPMGTNKTPGGLDLKASDKKAIASTGISPDIATLAAQKLDYMGASPTDTGLAEEKAQLPKQTEEDKWTALANFGFSLAASKSKYFLQGVGEAGQSTVPMIQKNLETERATQRDIDKRDFDEAMQKYNVKGSAYDTAVTQFNAAADRANKLAIADKEAAAKIADANIAAGAARGAYAPGSPAWTNAQANAGYRADVNDDNLRRAAQNSVDKELGTNMLYVRLRASSKPEDQTAADNIYQDTSTRIFTSMGVGMPLGTNQQRTQQTLGQAKFLGFE